MSATEWDGYTSPKLPADDRPVSAEYAALWPSGTPGVSAAGEHQQQPKTTVMYPGEEQGKKRKRKPKPAPGVK